MENGKINSLLLIAFAATLGITGFFVLRTQARFLKADISTQVTAISLNPTTLAQCLAVKDIKVYGAYPCAQCEQQRQVFGKAWAYIHYIDCSDEQGVRIPKPQCRGEHIRTLPTWVFPDNLRAEGVISLEKLEEISGCKRI